MLFEKCCLILTLCQRHGCWCYGSLRRQDININSTGYKKLDSCAWWAFCQIRKNAGCACTGTQVPWCMPGSLTNGFLWSWWRGICSRYSGATHNYTHLVRGPWKRLSSIRVILTWTYIYIYIYKCALGIPSSCPESSCGIYFGDGNIYRECSILRWERCTYECYRIKSLNLHAIFGWTNN